MSTPITPMRRPPSRHASAVVPVGDTAVVCSGVASSLNLTLRKSITRRGSHFANITLWVIDAMHSGIRPFHDGALGS